MPRRPLPPSLVIGPFLFADATAAGVKWRRLRETDVVHPHRGVYAALDGVDPSKRGAVTERCEFALPILGQGRRFSHLTAARLWGMPLPFSWTEDEPLHVLSTAGVEPIRRPRIIGWESADTHPGEHIGTFPVSRPADVWCQLAVPGATGIESATGRRRRLSDEWLVAVGDFLLTGPFAIDGERVPLCTKADLIAAVRRHRGKRGARALAWAIENVRSEVHSPQETKLRLALIGCGLPEPERQLPVMTSRGIRHADLGYRTERVLIEYQGDHHRSDDRQWREDRTRRQLFEDAGYRVIEVTAADLVDGGFALANRIRRALAGTSFVTS